MRNNVSGRFNYANKLNRKNIIQLINRDTPELRIFWVFPGNTWVQTTF